MRTDDNDGGGGSDARTNGLDLPTRRTPEDSARGRNERGAAGGAHDNAPRRSRGRVSLGQRRRRPVSHSLLVAASFCRTFTRGNHLTLRSTSNGEWRL